MFGVESFLKSNAGLDIDVKHYSRWTKKILSGEMVFENQILH
jgi:hypothetical protein